MRIYLLLQQQNFFSLALYIEECNNRRDLATFVILRSSRSVNSAFIAHEYITTISQIIITIKQSLRSRFLHKYKLEIMHANSGWKQSL